MTWTGPDRTTHRFVVRRVQRFARTRGLPAALFRTDGRHVLDPEGDPLWAASRCHGGEG